MEEQKRVTRGVDQRKGGWKAVPRNEGKVDEGPGGEKVGSRTFLAIHLSRRERVGKRMKGGGGVTVEKCYASPWSRSR